MEGGSLVASENRKFYVFVKATPSCQEIFLVARFLRRFRRGLDQLLRIGARPFHEAIRSGGTIFFVLHMQVTRRSLRDTHQVGRGTGHPPSSSEPADYSHCRHLLALPMFLDGEMDLLMDLA